MIALTDSEILEVSGARHILYEIAIGVTGGFIVEGVKAMYNAFDAATRSPGTEFSMTSALDALNGGNLGS